MSPTKLLVGGYSEKRIASVTMVAFLTACAGVPVGANYCPIVDMKGRGGAQYETDLSECQAYAALATGAAQKAGTKAQPSARC
jgi:hypothetical protein